MTSAQQTRLSELRAAPYLARPSELDTLATALLNGGRGRGRKPAEQDWLTNRQLKERRRYEVPAGAGVECLSGQLESPIGRRKRKRGRGAD